jgi:hypothetical protein
MKSWYVSLRSFYTLVSCGDHEAGEVKVVVDYDKPQLFKKKIQQNYLFV